MALRVVVELDQLLPLVWQDTRLVGAVLVPEDATPCDVHELQPQLASGTSRNGPGSAATGRRPACAGT